jgi:hypothetical protein
VPLILYTNYPKKMAVKVLVNTLGQHILADTKQIENKESGDVVGYWLGNPRLVYYQQGEDGEVSVNFGSYCLISAENEFSVPAESIVSILSVREEVEEAYNKAVYGDAPADNGDGTVTAEVSENGVAPAPEAVEPETVQPEEVVGAETTV